MSFSLAAFFSKPEFIRIRIECVKWLWTWNMADLQYSILLLFSVTCIHMSIFQGQSFLKGLSTARRIFFSVVVKITRSFLLLTEMSMLVPHKNKSKVFNFPQEVLKKNYRWRHPRWWASISKCNKKPRNTLFHLFCLTGKIIAYSCILHTSGSILSRLRVTFVFKVILQTLSKQRCRRPCIYRRGDREDRKFELLLMFELNDGKLVHFEWGTFSCDKKH